MNTQSWDGHGFVRWEVEFIIVAVSLGMLLQPKSPVQGSPVASKNEN